MEYKSQNVICQNCKSKFTIETEDFNFYEKIKVPAPTWCSDCRQQRRYAWRNERTLYRRDCDLCGKSTVTIYSPNKDLKVYCLKCWWGDGWDPVKYGKDFDFTRPFFEQYKELQREVPRMALLSKNSVNSDYTNHSGNNKNAYLSFVCFDSEDILHSNWIIKSRNSIDLSYIHTGAEKSYECIDSQKIYNCQYSYLIENCTDCFYCNDCRNCSDCFLSFNLRNKSYVFENQQYSRDEYFKKISKYNLSSYKTRQEIYNRYIDILKNKSIHKNIIGEKNTDCTGNMLFNCKNLDDCFDCIDNTENSKYIISATKIKNAIDMYHIGWGSELSYECHACNNLYQSKVCHLCYDNSFLEYCDTCQNSQNLFGCISVKKGEYMILNKKYNKEEYEVLKEKIIENMKKTGEYGEFFPPSIAPVCYNETQGNYYMPLIKEEVLKRGWLWEDRVPGIFGKETLLPENIPDTIEEVEDSILSEALKCIECKKNYNIVQNELTFYRREKIPIPHKCPECRYKERFNLRLPRKLWDRKCMKCNIDIKTAYAPERPEIVYCESCYNKEIY